MSNALDQVYLPKWAGITVVGESIGPAQAQVVIIRTTRFWFSTNDKAFERELYRELGISAENYTSEQSEQIEAAEQKYGVLELEYLCNQRVVSSYIGGPHGWCDWSGTIFFNAHNVGKHPSATEIHRELLLIAEAFPFLTMNVELLNDEWGEPEAVPAVGYAVDGGQVAVEIAPAERLAPAPLPQEVEVSVLGGMMDVIINPSRERGCTIKLFRNALARTLSALESEKGQVEQ